MKIFPVEKYGNKFFLNNVHDNVTQVHSITIWNYLLYKNINIFMGYTYHIHQNNEIYNYTSFLSG